MYAELIFRKPLNEVTEEDLKEYFKEKQTESDKLEFKSYIDYPDKNSTKSERDKIKISKIINTICAFLNSDGGLLIWGAPKEPEKKSAGELTPVDLELKKDSIISKITDTISPTPNSIRFHSISCATGGYIYLFEVEKSEFSPHQNAGTYYMRIDGATHPAPHHFVEALMKKITYPKLSGKITLDNDYSRHIERVLVTPILLRISNNSKLLPAKNVNFKITSEKCDLFEPDVILPPKLNYFASITHPTYDFLHYGMPLKIYLLIVIPHFNQQGWEANLTLSVWAENCPLIYSDYKLIISPHSGGFLNIRIISKSENKLYMDSTINNSNEEVELENKADLQTFMREFNYNKGGI